VTEREYFVYILLCADETFYVGSTDNIERRVVEHAGGKGARYTRGRGPVKVVYLETFQTRSQAMGREVAIKKLGRAGKEKLVAGFGKRP
jgi:putative endonuclease